MEENNSKEKEINLLQLITLFFVWLKKIGIHILNVFTYLFRLLYRHMILTGIVVVICLGFGIYLSRSSVRTYKAEAMAMLYGSESQTVKEICKQLEEFNGSDKLTSLATKLSIPDSVAKNIVGFNSYYVIDYLKDKTPDKIDFDNKNSLTDTLNLRMKDRLYLQVLTHKINQIPQVQKAILNFFNNNTVMKSEFIAKRNDFIQQINVCDLEFQRIDSLAKISYYKDSEKQMRFDKDKLIVGDQKKQLFYDDLLHLKSIKSWAEFNLANCANPVVLPSDFVVNPIPINGRIKYSIIGIIIGLVLSTLIAIFIENSKNVIVFLKNK
jgi:hypothetical protein